MRRCRYCKGEFYPRRGSGGSEQQFCCADHRKSFWKSGSLPYEKLAMRVEKRADEAVLARLADFEKQLGELRARMDALHPSA